MWLAVLLLLWFGAQWVLLRVDPVLHPGTVEYWPPTRVRDGLLASAVGVVFWFLVVASCASAVSASSDRRWLKAGWPPVAAGAGVVVVVGAVLGAVRDGMTGATSNAPADVVPLWSSGWAWFVSDRGWSASQSNWLSLAAASLDLIVVAAAVWLMRSATPRTTSSEDQRRRSGAVPAFLVGWVCVISVIIMTTLLMTIGLPTSVSSWLVAAWPLWLCTVMWVWALVRSPAGSTANRLAAALGWTFALTGISVAAGADWPGANGLLPTPSTSPGFTDLSPSVSFPVLSAATTCCIFLAWVSPVMHSWLQAHTTVALIATLAANLTDAIATSLALNAGRAAELNPLVNTFGLEQKVLVGTALILLLWRLRPALLWAPLLVLVAVNAYHLAGLVAL